METNYLTVSALTSYIKYKFDADPYLGKVFLTGEISNFRLRANAHQYFSLKDDRAKISAIMFKQAFQKLPFEPKEGMKVLVVGRISLYEPSGNYQIYVERMEPDGIGALYQALAERKEKLQKEGLFSGPKKILPRYPKKIAIVTSPSGAVIRDIITTVKRRYPIVQLVLYPTVVQGDKSASSICQNIQRIEADGSYDTLILARGGGSIEDLWPFNEEQVARAIHEASVPVISSVGHETDTTIADLVADVRAATPTAAAELAVPVLSEELQKINLLENRLTQAFSYQLKKANQQLMTYQHSYIFEQPQRLYEGFLVKLDLYNQQLNQQFSKHIGKNKEELTQLDRRLIHLNPQPSLDRQGQQLAYLTERLQKSMEHLLVYQQDQLANEIASLDMLSPLKTMARGYTYVTDDKEQIIYSVQDMKETDTITIHLHDGQVTANVLQTRKDD